MSRKRKRKRARARPRGARGSVAPGETERGTPVSQKAEGPARGAPRARQEDQRPRGLFRGGAQSPFPPFGVSLSAGLRAVGSSPLILAVAFASTILTWATFAALGAPLSLQFMVVQMAASPVHVFFDWLAVSPLQDSGTYLLLATIILGIVRAATFGTLLVLITGVLRGDGAGLRESLKSLPATGLSLFAVYIAEVVVMAASQFVLGGSQLFFLLVPLVALHFLAFVPVVVVAEKVTAREGFRRGFRAARLPGGRHLGMAVAYFLFVFYLLNGTPGLTPATPSILGWAFVLVVSFVHVGVLATFTFRWLAVREEDAITAPAPTRQASRRSPS